MTMQILTSLFAYSVPGGYCISVFFCFVFWYGNNKSWVNVMFECITSDFELKTS